MRNFLFVVFVGVMCCGAQLQALEEENFGRLLSQLDKDINRLAAKEPSSFEEEEEGGGSKKYFTCTHVTPNYYPHNPSCDLRLDGTTRPILKPRKHKSNDNVCGLVSPYFEHSLKIQKGQFDQASKCIVDKDLWRGDLHPKNCPALANIPLLPFEYFTQLPGSPFKDKSTFNKLVLPDGTVVVAKQFRDLDDFPVFCDEITPFHEVYQGTHDPNQHAVADLAQIATWTNKVKIAYDLHGWMFHRYNPAPVSYPFLGAYIIMQNMHADLQTLMTTPVDDGNNGDFYFDINAAYVPDGAKLKNLIWQMADALTKLHALGIASNDVKLDNFMVPDDDHDNVLLIDFGESRRMTKYHENPYVPIPGSGYANTPYAEMLYDPNKSDAAWAEVQKQQTMVLKQMHGGGLVDARIQDMYRLGLIIKLLVKGETLRVSTFQSRAGFPIPLDTPRRNLDGTVSGDAWSIIINMLLSHNDQKVPRRSYDYLFGRNGVDVMRQIKFAPDPDVV